MRSAARISLAAALTLAGSAAAQPGDLTVLMFTHQPAPGVSGPYLISSGGSPIITESGWFVAVDDMTRENAARRRGVFISGNGLPLTNIADENTDVAIAEFGPDDIVDIPANSPFRVSDAGMVTFGAYLATPYPVEGGTSTFVTLQGDGSGPPVVVSRLGQGPVVSGEPLAIWHDISTSPNGQHSCFFVETDWVEPEIWTTDGITTGQRFVAENDPAVVGISAPAEWNDWVVRNVNSPVVGDSGLIAFEAELWSASTNQRIGAAVLTGRAGVGYAPLFDPRSPDASFPGLPVDPATAVIEYHSATSLSLLGDDSLLLRGTVAETTEDEYIRGVWRIDSAGTGTALLVQGSAAPGLDSGEVIGGFPSTRIDRDGGMSVFVELESPTFPWPDAYYTIGPAGEVNLAVRPDHPVMAPGISPDPVPLAAIRGGGTRLPDGRFFFSGILPDTRFGARSGTSNCLIYTDENGDLRTLPFYAHPLDGGQLFDFDPTSGVDEAPLKELSGLVLPDGEVLLRFASNVNGRSLHARSAINPPTCPVDVNGDGDVSPADFNAWILAFNSASPACDQNGDGLCTPADFNAWILNFNAGC